MSAAPLNVLRTKAGKLAPICEFCGRVGRAVESDDGRIGLWRIAQGWAIAPYPSDFVHHDGSTGDLFTCPACRKRLERGESLFTRAYLASDATDGHSAISEDSGAERVEPEGEPFDAERVERSAARARASYRARTESRQDAEHYVRNVLGEHAPAHDVEAIADELHTATGSWDMRQADSGRFWAAVRRHALDIATPHCADWPLCGHDGEGGCP